MEYICPVCHNSLDSYRICNICGTKFSEIICPVCHNSLDSYRICDGCGTKFSEIDWLIYSLMDFFSMNEAGVLNWHLELNYSSIPSPWLAVLAFSFLKIIDESLIFSKEEIYKIYDEFKENENLEEKLLEVAKYPSGEKLGFYNVSQYDLNSIGEYCIKNKNIDKILLYNMVNDYVYAFDSQIENILESFNLFEMIRFFHNENNLSDIFSYLYGINISKRNFSEKYYANRFINKFFIKVADLQKNGANYDIDKIYFLGDIPKNMKYDTDLYSFLSRFFLKDVYLEEKNELKVYDPNFREGILIKNLANELEMNGHDCNIVSYAKDNETFFNGINSAKNLFDDSFNYDNHNSRSNKFLNQSLNDFDLIISDFNLKEDFQLWQFDLIKEFTYKVKNNTKIVLKLNSSILKDLFPAMDFLIYNDYLDTIILLPQKKDENISDFLLVINTNKSEMRKGKFLLIDEFDKKTMLSEDYQLQEQILNSYLKFKEYDNSILIENKTIKDKMIFTDLYWELDKNMSFYEIDNDDGGMHNKHFEMHIIKVIYEEYLYLLLYKNLRRYFGKIDYKNKFMNLIYDWDTLFNLRKSLLYYSKFDSLLEEEFKILYNYNKWDFLRNSIDKDLFAHIIEFNTLPEEDLKILDDLYNQYSQWDFYEKGYKIDFYDKHFNFHHLIYNKNNRNFDNLKVLSEISLIFDLSMVKKALKIEELLKSKEFKLELHENSLYVHKSKPQMDKQQVYYHYELEGIEIDEFLELVIIDKNVSIDYVYTFLNSNKGIKELLFFSRGDNELSEINLNYLRIPIPSIEEQENIIQAVSKSKIFFNSIDMLKTKLSNNILDFKPILDDIAEFEGNMVPEVNNIEMNQNWKHLYGELLWPLAITYLSVTKGSFEKSEKLDKYLKLFEFVTAFDVILLLSAIPEEDYKNLKDEIWGNKFKYYYNMNFGSWYKLLERLSKIYKENAFSTVLDKDIFLKISNEKTLKIIEKPYKIRNNEHHGALRNSYESEKIVKTLDSNLYDLFEILSALSGYKLYYIISTNAEIISENEIIYKVITLNGPCSQPIYNDFIYHKFLKTNNLYLYDKFNDKLLMLNPNLIKFVDVDKSRDEWALYIFNGTKMNKNGNVSAKYKCYQKKEEDLYQDIESFKEDIFSLGYEKD